MVLGLNAEPIYLGLLKENNRQPSIHPMKFKSMTAKRISSGQTTNCAAKKDRLYKRRPGQIWKEQQEKLNFDQNQNQLY